MEPYSETDRLAVSSGEIPADSYGRSDKVHGSSGEVLVDSHGRDESVRDFLFSLNTSLESSARPISGLNDLYASEVPLRQVLTGWSPSTRGAQSHGRYRINPWINQQDGRTRDDPVRPIFSAVFTLLKAKRGANTRTCMLWGALELSTPSFPRSNFTTASGSTAGRTGEEIESSRAAGRFSQPSPPRTHQSEE